MTSEWVSAVDAARQIAAAWFVAIAWRLHKYGCHCRTCHHDLIQLLGDTQVIARAGRPQASVPEIVS